MLFRSGQRDYEKSKHYQFIRCPKCRAKIAAEYRIDVSDIWVIAEHGDRPADYFVACSRCKVKLGLKKRIQQVRLSIDS